MISPKKVDDRPLRKKKPQPQPKLVLNLLHMRPRIAEALPDSCFVTMTGDDNEGSDTLDLKVPTPEFQFHDRVDLSKETCQQLFSVYVDKMTVTEQIADQIEMATRGQAKNPSWHEARFGRLTSSQFGSVMSRKPATPPDNLVKSIMGFTPYFETPATRWGKVKEVAARRQYFNVMQKVHSHMTVTGDCGLVISLTEPFLAASPDGLVQCPDCNPTAGLVEIKCPFKWRSSMIKAACEDADFCCQMHEGNIQLKRSHAYYFQVQGQMGITDRKWCDFVVWTCQEMHVERIKFDEELWMDMKQKLRMFYTRGVVAELFSSRVERKKPLYAV